MGADDDFDGDADMQGAVAHRNSAAEDPGPEPKNRRAVGIQLTTRLCTLIQILSASAHLTVILPMHTFHLKAWPHS